MALAVNLGNEKSPKSESDSLSLNGFFVDFEIGFAVADFFGTARELADADAELVFPLEFFFETFFDFSAFGILSLSEKSSLEQLRSFAARPFFSFLEKMEPFL